MISPTNTATPVEEHSLISPTNAATSVPAATPVEEHRA